MLDHLYRFLRAVEVVATRTKEEKEDGRLTGPWKNRACSGRWNDGDNDR